MFSSKMALAEIGSVCELTFWYALEKNRMSRSIHWTYEIFKHKSKRELIEMCDTENPDYAVKELREKIRIKRDVKNKRAEKKISLNEEENDITL